MDLESQYGQGPTCFVVFGIQKTVINLMWNRLCVQKYMVAHTMIHFYPLGRIMEDCL